MPISIYTAKTFCLDLLFPKLCLSCAKEGSFFCLRCSAGLRALGPACWICKKRGRTGTICTSCRKKTFLRRVFAPFSYADENIRNIIHTFKYERVKELGPVLAEVLIKELVFSGFKARKDRILIPIPLHRNRERERGFNQSGVLANMIGNNFHIAVLPGVMVRKRNTPAQIEMKNDTERYANIYDAFQITNPAAVTKKIVILVDDVITSGATLEEAARVLKESGARSVWAIAVARR